MPFPVDVVDNWVDYFALLFSFLAAFGTVVAVGVSVQTARNASSQTAKAERATQEANDRSVAAQLEASEVIAKTEMMLEEDRKQASRRASTEQKANRQAVDVVVWPTREWGSPRAGDRQAYVSVRVVNQSERAISDIEVSWAGSDGAAHNEILGRKETLPGWENLSYGALADIAALHPGEKVPRFTLRFTDRFQDRWELAPDRSLYLLTPRLIDVSPDKV